MRYILVQVILIFFNIFFLRADEALEKLKIIEKKIQNNKEIEKKLKLEQNKINNNLKKIESMQKINEKKIKTYFMKERDLELKLDKFFSRKQEIKKIEDSLHSLKNTIANNLIKDSFTNQEERQINNLLIFMFNNTNNKIITNKNSFYKIEDSINKSKLELKKIEQELAKINSNLSRRSELETSLQGENIITMIQRKEKELERIVIGKKAKKLKDLIESLKKNPGEYREGTTVKNYKLKKIEDILPVKLKNIEKMRTDRSKKGILLTLRDKSFLTTPREGLVVYADSFKGYGNMIILDLGNNYHLIYSGFTSIMCSVGDWLNTGNILGQIETTDKKREMYLEVRFKGKTINPSSWIKS